MSHVCMIMFCLHGGKHVSMKCFTKKQKYFAGNKNVNTKCKSPVMCVCVFCTFI